MRLTKVVSMLRVFYPNDKSAISTSPSEARSQKQEAWSVLEKSTPPVSQVVCSSGNELGLPLSMTMEGIEGSLGTCLMLGLEHVLKPILFSLGKKPCRTPATTTSGRSAGTDRKTFMKMCYINEFLLTGFILNSTLIN